MPPWIMDQQCALVAAKQASGLGAAASGASILQAPTTCLHHAPELLACHQCLRELHGSSQLCPRPTPTDQSCTLFPTRTRRLRWMDADSGHIWAEPRASCAWQPAEPLVQPQGQGQQWGLLLLHWGQPHRPQTDPVSGFCSRRLAYEAPYFSHRHRSGNDHWRIGWSMVYGMPLNETL